MEPLSESAQRLLQELENQALPCDIKVTKCIFLTIEQDYIVLDEPSPPHTPQEVSDGLNAIHELFQKGLIQSDSQPPTSAGGVLLNVKLTDKAKSLLKQPFAT